MPGYETERFVNLSQNDKAELICSICQDILCNPLVAQCCQQSFCGDCINDWLKNNNTCPYDRKILTSSGLTRPPRIMLNMLGKLKLNCDYKENGCKEVLLLENLSQHLIICRYNVKNCNKCLCEIQDKSSHDCIKILLELNRKLKEENESLKRNASSKVVSHPLAQISEELATNNSNKSSFTEIFNQARKSLWKPEVINTDMNVCLSNEVLSIVRNELLKEYNIDSDLSKNIVDKLNSEFGSSWYCIAAYQSKIKSTIDYEFGFMISLRFSELYLKIYKTQFFVMEELAQRLRNGKIKRQIEILKTDMKENMISDVKKITFEAIEKSTELKDLSSELRTLMEKRYPGKWLCFIFAHFGTYSMIPKRNTYIYFKVDNLNLTLFQAFI